MAETTSEKIYDLECRQYDKHIDTLGREKFLDGVKHMEQIIEGDQFCDLHVLDLFCNKNYLCLKHRLRNRCRRSEISGNDVERKANEEFDRAQFNWYLFSSQK